MERSVKEYQYETYMKCVTDNFIAMQRDAVTWCVDWKPEQGLRWSNFHMREQFRLEAYPDAIKKHNGKVALEYLQYNTKSFEEWSKSPKLVSGEDLTNRDVLF